MHCYCYNEIVTRVNKEGLDISFSDVKQGDEKEYCREWFTAYVIHRILDYTISLIPVIINAIVVIIFRIIGPFGRFFTKNNETEVIFFMITLFQFANLALLDLLLSFKVYQEMINSWNLLNGQYQDFT